MSCLSQTSIYIFQNTFFVHSKFSPKLLRGFMDKVAALMFNIMILHLTAK